MANYQVGYGHSDIIGVPFDYYTGPNNLVTGLTITMQTACLVLQPSATLAALVVNLPLNPPDGCVAEISLIANSGVNITSLAVQANSGDTISAVGLGTATALNGPATSASAGSAANTIKYRYTLNGFQPASGAALNARTWLRVQ
jgi:hypothetical protein